MEKTRPQRIDPRQVESFVADALKKAAAARKNLAIDAEAAYQIAYEAMIKGSSALMLSYGERPRKQLGHHIVIIEFAQAKLKTSRPEIFALFDRMRRKRNDAFYDITHISDTEAQGAVDTAEGFLRLIVADIRARRKK